MKILNNSNLDNHIYGNENILIKQRKFNWSENLKCQEAKNLK